MAGFDIARRHLIRGLQAGDQFARSENLDLEVAVRRFGQILRQDFRPAIDGVQRLGKGRGQTPRHLGRGLGEGGRGQCGSTGATQGGLGQKRTTIH